jgi:hypothetical protein
MYLERFVVAIWRGHAFGVFVCRLALREDVSRATRRYDVLETGNTSAASFIPGARLLR